MKRSLTGLVVMVFIVGCATTENYEALLKGWKGRSEEELVKEWGAPSSVFQNSSSKYYTYVRNKTCGGANDAYFTCVCSTTFELENSTIVSWRWDGNGCRALPPELQKSVFPSGRG